MYYTVVSKVTEGNDKMTRYIVRIDGMMCARCEEHMNEAVKSRFKVKSVESSHSERQTVIVTDQPLDVEELGRLVAQTGYTLIDIIVEPYGKKGFWEKIKGKFKK